MERKCLLIDDNKRFYKNMVKNVNLIRWWNYFYEVINDEMNKIKNCFLKFFNIFFFCKFLGGMYVVCEYSGVFCGKYEFSSIFVIWIYIYWFRWLFKCEYW